MSKKTIKQCLEEIENFRLKQGISKREIAEMVGVPYNTFEKWYEGGKSRREPSLRYVRKIKKFLQLLKENKTISRSLFHEAKRRTDKIKCLLLFLEEELAWFRDGEKESRDVLRENLDFDDVGYISSLLTMIGDEEKFQRWRALTTNRFGYFRKRGGKEE